MAAGHGHGETGTLCPSLPLLACPEGARILGNTLPLPSLVLEHLCPVAELQAFP